MRPMSTWLANAGLTGNRGIAVGEAVAARYLPLRRLDPDPPQTAYTGVNAIRAGGALDRVIPAEPAADTFADGHRTLDGQLRSACPDGARRAFRAPPPPELTSAQ